MVDACEPTRNALAMRLAVEADMEVVGSAADASTALLLAAQVRPDVVLMDVCLRKNDGFELMRQLRAMLPDTSLVVLTLYGDPGKRAAAMAAGACAFREKDGNCSALVDAIREAARVPSSDAVV